MLTYCEVDVSPLNTLSVEGPTKSEPDGVRVLVQPHGMECESGSGWCDVPGALPLTVWNLTPQQARWIGYALLHAAARNTDQGV